MCADQICKELALQPFYRCLPFSRTHKLSSDFSSSDLQFVYSFGSELFAVSPFPPAIAWACLVSIALWSSPRSHVDSLRSRLTSDMNCYSSQVKTPEAKN